MNDGQVKIPKDLFDFYERQLKLEKLFSTSTIGEGHR